MRSAALIVRLLVEDFVSHHGSGWVGAPDLGEPGSVKHGESSGEDGGWRRAAGESAGVYGVAVEHRGAMLRGPGDSGVEQCDSDALFSVFAAHHEAGHPPCIGIVVEDPGQCTVFSDSRERGARYDPRPADDVVVEVGQQADRDFGVAHFASKGAPIVGFLMSKKSLAPA